MRLLICGGGTAGHVYPAIAVARALSGGGRNVAVLALGSKSPRDRELFESAGYEFEALGGAPLTGMGARLPANAVRTALAAGIALRAVGRFHPDAALSTGAYAAVPGTVACFARRVPVVLLVSDSRPGRAAALIGRFATAIATATEEAASRFEASKTWTTGYPLREEFASPDGARARRRLGLAESRRTVLISGGSQGSELINQTCAAILPDLLAAADVVHLTGSAHIARHTALKQRLPAEAQDSYHPIAYLAEGMADLMCAADLAVARAGGSVHELAATGLPSILIPGSFAGGHQAANARWLANGRAALVIPESELSPPRLLDAAMGLLDKPDELERMASAAMKLGRRDAAARVAEILLEAVQERRAA